MALKDFAQGRTDVYAIDPRKLQVKDGWNSRDFSDPANIEHVEQLAKSIAEVGVREPLKVYVENDIPYVTNGECRYRAVMLLIERNALPEKFTVPVMNEGRYANEADRLFTQFISNSGKPFGPIENARLFKRLVDMGWAQKDIAGKSGMTGGRISQILELNTLPVSLQQLIIEGKASANMVLQVFKKHNGNLDAAYAELTAAIGEAQKQGRTRALPRDGEGSGEGEGGSGKSGKGTGGQSLKAYFKKLVEQAYAEERIDDTENMVTMSLSEEAWAELMEKIDY